MCIILDASVFDAYCKGVRNMGPVRKWVEKDRGNIVYSPVDKIRKEWNRHDHMKDKIPLYRRLGVLQMVNAKEVLAQTKALRQSRKLRSDDPHIIALAKVGGATLLVSEDKKLWHDFVAMIKNGKTYHSNTSPKTIQNHQCPSK
ncbi:MAG: type II toxin-antitoxin system VapC family toxin [Gammaproteobacteria bacterium]